LITTLKYMPINLMSNMAQNDFVEVAKVNEIPDGKMKHFEVNNKEMMLANLDGKFYALSDRCGHTNARHEFKIQWN
jgi:nitrite reductase/ring-hydroxylating ferredoxin subunit